MQSIEVVKEISMSLIRGFGDDFRVIEQSENSVGILVTWLQYKDTGHGISLSVPRSRYYARPDVVADCLPLSRSSDGWCVRGGDYIRLKTDDDTRKIAQRIDDGEFDAIWDMD